VTRGWATFSGGDRPVLVLTEDGRAVMRGERPARLRLPPLSAAPAKPAAPAARRPASDQALVDDPVARALFEALRGHRLALAREQGVPPYVIASDRSLRELAEVRPRTLDALRLAHGIGPHKVERYGAGLLAVVAGVLAAVPDRPDPPATS
jgi:ATP-dependent DNA helicase RecQ